MQSHHEPSPVLFHLIPQNPHSRAVLKEQDNRRFLSQTGNEELGLGIGFHVASLPSRVVARVGRNADIILPDPSISAVHFAFEMSSERPFLMLTARSRRRTPVLVTLSDQIDPVEGGCVIPFGTACTIELARYKFALAWRSDLNAQRLERLAQKELALALQRQQYARPRDLLTVEEPVEQTWMCTRLPSVKKNLVRELHEKHREKLGSGGFGTVYKTMDVHSGAWFALKTVELRGRMNRERAYREIKALDHLKHENIIELLGHDKWDSDNVLPELYMPLRDGNLETLMTGRAARPDDNDTCFAVLYQMLSALDFLDSRGWCHRDVKPQNILYYRRNDKLYVFQLADFGLANRVAFANSSVGTIPYQAPELFTDAAQTDSRNIRMDIWSLLVTVLSVHPRVRFAPDVRLSDLKPYHQKIMALGKQDSVLADMAEIEPRKRASAAQMLKLHFDCRGLSTPKHQIPELHGACRRVQNRVPSFEMVDAV